MYGKSVLFCRVASIRNVRFFKKDSSKKLLEFLADMPKPKSSRIADAQRQRQQISKKSDKYAPSTCYLQVLGSGARGAPGTLYLFTDQKRYLFNCGECTQRLAHEHKVKLSRLDHIFITSKTWKNIGGLPGLSLTLQDVGVPNITLHGPEGLDELYNATKRFVIMKDMNVTMANCSPSEDFEDNVMKVKYVVLGPHDDILAKDLKPAAKKPKISDPVDKEYEEFVRDNIDYYRPEIRNLDTHKKIPEPKKYVKERIKPRTAVEKEKQADPLKMKTEKVLHDLQKKSNCSVSYVCTLKKRFGTLDLAKCVELGVKPGPMLGQLKSGQDVVLSDGTLVLSKDVKTPDDPGPVFIVLEVPDLSYLKEAEFSSHFNDGVNPPENIPALIVHYTPPHVFHDPAYRAFMSLFGPSTRHLIINGQNSCLGSEAVHRTQQKLHLLDPDIFPLLRDGSVAAVWNAHPPVPKTNSPIRLKGLEELKNKIALAQFQNIINMEGSCKGDCRPSSVEEPEAEKLDFMIGRTLTVFHLRPKKQLDRSSEPKLHIQDYIQETMDVDGFVGSLQQFRRLVDSMRFARTGSQREYPKVVFLGTGSCIPSKTRNTSAIVIHIDEDRSILLDCGEGTFGQLVRFYGTKRVSAFLRTLCAVYISHLHADHHIGLIGVIQARRQAFEEINPDEPPNPVYLLAPGQIVSWLSIYDHQFERIRGEFTLIPNQSLVQDVDKQDPEMTSAVLASIGLQNIQTCVVAHCPNAFGVSLQVAQYKITYSGDTIPCDALVKLGENSTLLIHEATMEDELAEEARTKMHSTTTQAIEVGRQMNAQYTVLTHFSQRYARLPRLNANILNDNNSVGIAFDNMQITMSDLELLPHMYAPLQLMFAEHCVEMELKAAHRARQKELRVPPIEAVASDVAKKRRLSPGCQGALSSLPCISPGRYRESNSSRLRHKVRGMTMSGSVGATPRSKSTTPNQKSRSSTPGSRTSSISTLQSRKATSADGSVDVHSAPRSLTDVYLAAPESGNVFDTRSKTISSVTPEKVSEARRKYADKGPIFTNDVSNGYGKPLVTPMNRRLNLLRDDSQLPPVPSSSMGKQTISPMKRKISPEKRKAENRWCSSTNLNNKSVMNKIKLPAKSFDSAKCRGPNVCANVIKEKTSRSPVAVKGLRSTTSSQNRLGRTSPKRASSLERKPQDPKKYSSYTKIKSANPSSDKTAKPEDSSGSPTRPSRIPRAPVPLPRKSASSKVGPPKAGPKYPHKAEERRVPGKSSPSLQDGLHKIHKRMPINKDTRPISVIGRPNSANQSMKSFRPQLEDIKSSFILISKMNNKKANERNAKDNERKNLPAACKPKPLDDGERRQQLHEIRTQYQTKGFLDEARFEKIEGLNWISWK